MTTPSYQRYVASGELSQADADALDAARNHGRLSAQSIEAGDHMAHLDAVMLGVIDAACGILSRTYGAMQTAEIFEHYGEVCRRNAEAEQ